MTLVRDTSITTSSGGISTASPSWPSGTEVGDRAFSLIYGGNNPNGWYPSGGDYPDDWKSLGNRTGQEAQGRVLTKIITQSDLDDGFYEVYFDGNDPYRIVTIVTVGNCGYQLITNERDGQVAHVFPAEAFNKRVRMLDSEVTAFFVGARNGTALPQSNRGTLTHSYVDTGFWLYEADGNASFNSVLTAPERSGHYRAILRMFQWAEGEWNTDADEVLLPSDGHNSLDKYDATHLRNPSWISGYTSPSDSFPTMLGNSWDGTGGAGQGQVDTIPGGGGLWYIHGDTTPPNNTVGWSQVWCAVERKVPTSPATSSEYPGSPPPDAIDVEWEPTDEALSYVLTVDPGGGSGYVEAYGPDPATGPDTVGYKYVDNVSAPNDGYDPGWKSRTQITSVQATEPVLWLGTHAAYSGHAFALPAGSIGSHIAATVVDAITMLGDTAQGSQPWMTANPGLQYAISVSLQAVVRPRYRFLFDPLPPATAIPARRLFPRASSRRVFPPPQTAQLGRRIGPGAPP